MDYRDILCNRTDVSEDNLCSSIRLSGIPDGMCICICFNSSLCVLLYAIFRQIVSVSRMASRRIAYYSRSFTHLVLFNLFHRIAHIQNQNNANEPIQRTPTRRHARCLVASLPAPFAPAVRGR